MALGDGTAWSESTPTDSGLISDTGKEVRDLRIGSRIRLAKEHVTPAASSAGGEHKAGSARVYRDTTLNAPTLRPDGTTALDASDEGRLWLNNDTGVLNVWTGSAWVPVRSSGEVTKLTIDAIDEDPEAFVVGMICTQATSNALGYFLSRDDTYAWFQVVSGTFDSTHQVSGTGDTPPTLTPSAATTTSPAVVLAEPYVKVSETAGGSLSAGAWQGRFASIAEDSDAQGICSQPGGGVIRLPAGTYRCRILVPAFAVDKHRARLWDNTASALVLEGSSAFASASYEGFSYSEVSGRFVLTTESDLVVQSYCKTSNTTNGKGQASTPHVPSNDHNTFATAEFWKENI